MQLQIVLLRDDVIDFTFSKCAGEYFLSVNKLGASEKRYLRECVFVCVGVYWY